MIVGGVEACGTLCHRGAEGFLAAVALVTRTKASRATAAKRRRRRRIPLLSAVSSSSLALVRVSIGRYKCGVHVPEMTKSRVFYVAMRREFALSAAIPRMRDYALSRPTLRPLLPRAMGYDVVTIRAEVGLYDRFARLSKRSSCRSSDAAFAKAPRILATVRATTSDVTMSATAPIATQNHDIVT